MNRSHETTNTRRKGPLVRVFDTNDLLDCAGWVPVPRRHFSKLKGLRWVAQPPDEPLDSLEPEDVALFEWISGIGVAIFLPDLVAALDRPEPERRMILARVDCFGGETYSETADWSGYNRDIQWSAIHVGNERYRIDTADLLILDGLGLGWDLDSDGIIAWVCEVAGVEIYVEMGATVEAARQNVAVGSRGENHFCGVLCTKEEWMEQGGTEETWEPEHWCPW
jgi:hypothetical protein